MASSGVIFHNALSLLLHQSKCDKTGMFASNPSEFFSSKSLFKLKEQAFLSATRNKQSKHLKTHALPNIYAAQSNLFKVIQTVWKVGKDGIDAGTNLVPESIPRPIARISVTVVGVVVALFVLKSFLSTAFFVLAVMGLSYFIFIAWNKGDGPSGDGDGTSVDDSLEEARRIMDKYK